MDRISIFVPIYHREETVRVAAKRLLETYRSEGYKVNIVFIDNRSDDSLRNFLKDLTLSDPNIMVRLLPKNDGKSKAINDAAKKYCAFEWFISCDSDILHYEKGWPGILVECYKSAQRAGMVSVEYTNNGNNPMPKQPKDTVVTAYGKERIFHFGGQVAGGCFVTSKEVWDDIGYRTNGVYGGVDGIFRQNVADSLMRKCGYIEGVMADHMDDRSQNEEYHAWKLKVQDNIRKFSALGDPKKIGNNRGFWD